MKAGLLLAVVLSPWLLVAAQAPVSSQAVATVATSSSTPAQTGAITAPALDASPPEPGSGQAPECLPVYSFEDFLLRSCQNDDIQQNETQQTDNCQPIFGSCWILQFNQSEVTMDFTIGTVTPKMGVVAPQNQTTTPMVATDFATARPLPPGAPASPEVAPPQTAEGGRFSCPRGQSPCTPSPSFIPVSTPTSAPVPPPASSPVPGLPVASPSSSFGAQEGQLGDQLGATITSGMFSAVKLPLDTLFAVGGMHLAAGKRLTVANVEFRRALLYPYHTSSFQLGLPFVGRSVGDGSIVDLHNVDVVTTCDLLRDYAAKLPAIKSMPEYMSFDIINDNTTEFSTSIIFNWLFLNQTNFNMVTIKCDSTYQLDLPIAINVRTPDTYNDAHQTISDLGFPARILLQDTIHVSNSPSPAAPINTEVLVRPAPGRLAYLDLRNASARPVAPGGMVRWSEVWSVGAAVPGGYVVGPEPTQLMAVANTYYLQAPSTRSLANSSNATTAVFTADRSTFVVPDAVLHFFLWWPLLASSPSDRLASEASWLKPQLTWTSVDILNPRTLRLRSSSHMSQLGAAAASNQRSLLSGELAANISSNSNSNSSSTGPPYQTTRQEVTITTVPNIAIGMPPPPSADIFYRLPNSTVVTRVTPSLLLVNSSAQLAAALDAIYQSAINQQAVSPPPGVQSYISPRLNASSSHPVAIIMQDGDYNLPAASSCPEGDGRLGNLTLTGLPGSRIVLHLGTGQASSGGACAFGVVQSPSVIQLHQLTLMVDDVAVDETQPLALPQLTKQRSGSQSVLQLDGVTLLLPYSLFSAVSQAVDFVSSQANPSPSGSSSGAASRASLPSLTQIILDNVAVTGPFNVTPGRVNVAGMSGWGWSGRAMSFTPSSIPYPPPPSNLVITPRDLSSSSSSSALVGAIVGPVVGVSVLAVLVATAIWLRRKRVAASSAVAAESAKQYQPQENSKPIAINVGSVYDSSPDGSFGKQNRAAGQLSGPRSGESGKLRMTGSEGGATSTTNTTGISSHTGISSSELMLNPCYMQQQPQQQHQKLITSKSDSNDSDQNVYEKVLGALVTGPNFPEAAAYNVVVTQDLVAHTNKRRGVGATSIVVEGSYKGLPAAIKIMHMSSNKPAEDQIATFRQEVNVLSQVDHPNIVKLYAAQLNPPNIFLVEELMACTLDQVIHCKDELSLEQVLRIGQDIALALSHLHPTVIHRDLKPQNILMDANLTAKVSDFGLSRVKTMTIHMTESPMAGTAAYLAPECVPENGVPMQVGGLTEKVDIYSLGMVLWEMATRQRPWLGMPLGSIYCQIMQGQRPPLPPEGHARCPPALRRLIQKCWSVDPQLRPSAAEVYKKLALIRHALATQPQEGLGGRHTEMLDSRSSSSSSSADSRPELQQLQREYVTCISQVDIDTGKPDVV